MGKHSSQTSLTGIEPIWAAATSGPLHGAGVLLCHGFTGTPASVQPWAYYLASLGAAVACPVLPGHGSCWQQLALTTHEDWYSVLPPALDWLAEQTRIQVVAGLSMGGALALRVAELEPVAGVSLVNPSLGSDDLRYRLLPMLAKVLPSIPGIGNDIRRAGVGEPSYPRTPLAAAASMRRLWSMVVADLDQVRAPVQLFTSVVDHAVDGYSGRLLRSRLVDLADDRWLVNSWHVAPLDHDAGVINEASAAFIANLLRVHDEL